MQVKFNFLLPCLVVTKYLYIPLTRTNAYMINKSQKKIFKRQYSFLYVSGIASLFLSGRITLKVIFYYFHHYIFKVYKYSSPHFEKPTCSFIHRCRYALHFLHLKQWEVSNETESLIQVHYAEKPRNPE